MAPPRAGAPGVASVTESGIPEFGDLKSLHSYSTFTCAVGMGDMVMAVCRDLGISGSCEMAQSTMRRGGTEVGRGLWLQVPALIWAPPLNELRSFGQVTCPQWDTCLLFCKVQLTMLRAHGSLKGRETLPEGLLCIRCSPALVNAICAAGAIVIIQVRKLSLGKMK